MTDLAVIGADAAIRSHVAIDPAILYWGTPVVLISTLNVDGTANLAPMSSAFWLGHTGVLGLGLASHTAANLLRTRECVLNLPAENDVDAVDRLALTTGANPVNAWKGHAGYRYVGDKFGVAGLEAVASDTVSAPRAAQCPVAMEATLIAVHTTDFHLLTVQVKRVHVHESIRLAGHDNRIDPNRWRPLIMSFQNFYGLGEQVHPSRLAGIDEEHYRH
jgi:flavin reductase (DIM6/NTAB) family NADH-FMN oxidoreductase RutF